MEPTTIINESKHELIVLGFIYGSETRSVFMAWFIYNLFKRQDLAM